MKDLVYNDVTYRLVINDMGGQDDNAPVRIQGLKDQDMIMMCYSLNDINSVSCLTTKWVKEVDKAGLKVPIVLVGCKSDVQNVSVYDECRKIVDSSESRFSNEEHVTCSAKEGENVTDTFYKLIEAHLNREEIIQK